MRLKCHLHVRICFWATNGLEYQNVYNPKKRTSYVQSGHFVEYFPYLLYCYDKSLKRRVHNKCQMYSLKKYYFICNFVTAQYHGQPIHWKQLAQVLESVLQKLPIV